MAKHKRKHKRSGKHRTITAAQVKKVRAIKKFLGTLV
jgi:hypothetical protein